MINAADALHALQVSDMAGEYAAKLAVLHEESAARAEGDLRKRQQRYAKLSDLQAKAEVPNCPAAFYAAATLSIRGWHMHALV